MAKRKTSRKRSKSGDADVNKSEEIRSLLRANPGARPTEIVSALAEKGVTVTPGFVSNIKSKSKLGRRRRKKGRGRRVEVAAAGNTDLASFSSALVGAKKLASQLGGIDKAQQALDILKRLQD